MGSTTITIEKFLVAAAEFVKVSDRIGDGWKLKQDNTDSYKTFLRKDTFIQLEDNNISNLLKVEYVIFYNLSYGVPSFSFNIWNSTGSLLSLDDIRKVSAIQINEKDFYSVITQQEHPVLQRPYFIVHPCHTETLLAAFSNSSKNIIVTFLGLVTPLIKLNLPLDYGL
ncbi:ubiquitin-like-conjugating enzyme ATG10 isoform X2 [Trichoplusia ni]|uniref:Ubiquitin-like-conjugating enzyme ATG10 n=1 Tax=Trichoplusia ni TaxID=7111 RepID=A0A7E5VWR7_TRINI|nr:ubiquitin-like-conjugating enzyme ATG10 isoform X2 [Trichoplusia ni]